MAFLLYIFSICFNIESQRVWGASVERKWVVWLRMCGLCNICEVFRLIGELELVAGTQMRRRYSLFTDRLDRFGNLFVGMVHQKVKSLDCFCASWYLCAQPIFDAKKLLQAIYWVVSVHFEEVIEVNVVMLYAVCWEEMTEETFLRQEILYLQRVWILNPIVEHISKNISRILYN